MFELVSRFKWGFFILSTNVIKRSNKKFEVDWRLLATPYWGTAILYRRVIPYYPAFSYMHLYTKQHIFWSDQLVSCISACTKLFGCKCMHQYKKHLYFKLSSNFEILKVKIGIQALYDNYKRCSTL